MGITSDIDLKQLTIDESISHLKEKFPSVVTDDTRNGYSGVMIDKDKLRDVAQ